MKPHAALRLVALTHAVAICLLPVLAGVYLNGSSAAIRIHEPLGMAVAVIGLVQLILATLWWRSGGRPTAALVSLLIVLGEILQSIVGHTRDMAVHVPLAIALVAGTVSFAVWTFRRPAEVTA